MRIVIAAGGSGGHIFPALALAEKLREVKPGVDIVCIGSNRPLDRRIFERESLSFYLLSANKLPYRVSWGLVPFCVRSAFDLVKMIVIYSRKRPDAIIGFGGYVSCPAIIAGKLFSVPTVLHEQNVVPGRASRLLFNFVDMIALSFAQTVSRMGRAGGRARVTGNPIRAQVMKDDRALGARRFGLDQDKFTMLVIGGSQGAHTINKVFLDALALIDPAIRRSLQTIHITGPKDYHWAAARYEEAGLEARVFSFIDKIEEAYSASDLAITRSGASAICELAFFGRAMILIPYPYAASHQAENARVFAEKGAACVIEERELTPELFKEHILSLYRDRKRREALSASAKELGMPQAAELLAGCVCEMAEGPYGHR